MGREKMMNPWFILLYREIRLSNLLQQTQTLYYTRLMKGGQCQLLVNVNLKAHQIIESFQKKSMHFSHLLVFEENIINYIPCANSKYYSW